MLKMKLFLTVYDKPPYDYVKAFLKTSKNKYEMIDNILKMLVYRRREGLM